MPSARKTILFVHAADEMYGSDAILLETIRALEGTEFDAVVALPNDIPSELAPEIRLSGRLRALHVPVVSLPLAVLRRKYFTPYGILTLIRRQRTSARDVIHHFADRPIALVHSHTAAVLTGAACADRLGVPHVWHVSEIVERPAVVRRFIANTVTKRSDRVVSVSRAVRDHMLATAPRAANWCDVIYNGIDITPFATADGRALRQEIGAGERPVIGMIGRLGTWKGQELLLEAARHVVQEHPDALFLFIGGVFDGQLHHFDALRTAAARAGIADNVLVQGFRTDVPSVLAALDIFVQPSVRPDPFPTTVLEAMASRLPVVATAHGGPCEMVVHGQTGFLTSPINARELADYLLVLLRSPESRNMMGNAGRERVMAEFSLESFRQRYLALYRSLVD